MIQTLFKFLPNDLGTMALVLAIIGAGMGVALWLCGSKYSRKLVTLLTVALGMIVGMQLPAWFGWGLHAWASAVLAAIVFGVTGYACHKAWIGFGLGLVLACWAAVITCALCGIGAGPNGQPWTMPIATAGMSGKLWFISLWNSLGDQTRQVLPFACGAALLTGIGSSVLWPRLGTVMLYSSLGVSLLICLGTSAVLSTHKDWLRVVPDQMSSQMVVLLSLVAFGAIFQWRIVPAKLGDDPRAKKDEAKETQEQAQHH